MNKRSFIGIDFTSGLLVTGILPAAPAARLRSSRQQRCLLPVQAKSPVGVARSGQICPKVWAQKESKTICFSIFARFTLKPSVVQVASTCRTNAALGFCLASCGIKILPGSLSSASAFCMARLSSMYLHLHAFTSCASHVLEKHIVGRRKSKTVFQKDRELQRTIWVTGWKKNISLDLYQFCGSMQSAHPSMVSTPSCKRKKDQKRLIDLGSG